MANRSAKLGDDTGTALNQSDDVDDLQFVQSVGKAFRILRAFSTAQQLRGNQELAAATGLPRSTISRLSYTLTRLGYLNYVPDLMKYRLGDEALAFAGGILRGLDFRFAIRPGMRAPTWPAAFARGWTWFISNTRWPMFQAPCITPWARAFR